MCNCVTLVYHLEICAHKKRMPILQEKTGPLAVATPGAPPVLMTPNYMNLGYTDTLDLPAAAGKPKLEDLEDGGAGAVPATPARYVDPSQDLLQSTQTLAPEKMEEIERRAASNPNSPSLQQRLDTAGN